MTAEAAERPCFPWSVRVFEWLASKILTVLLGMLYRLRVHGAEHLPRTGGVLLASNHASFLDPLVLSVAARRRVIYTPRTTLSNNLLYRVMTTLCPLVPIGRGSADLAAIRRIVQVVRAGEVVGVFPEQTRTQDGLLGTPLGGVQVLAQRAGVPLIPVMIHGAFEAWPRHRRFPRAWGRIEVRFGPPRPEGMERDRPATLRWLEQSWQDLGGKLRTEADDAAQTGC